MCYKKNLKLKKKNCLEATKLERNIKEHNRNWSEISEYSYRKLIIESSGSGKNELII